MQCMKTALAVHSKKIAIDNELCEMQLDKTEDNMKVLDDREWVILSSPFLTRKQRCRPWFTCTRYWEGRHRSHGKSTILLSRHGMEGAA